ncbi:Or19a family protein [Megaselia abdita]
MISMYTIYKYIFHGALLFYIISAYLNHSLVFNGWIPFDWTASKSKYWFAFLYQSVSTFFIVIQNVSNDIYPCTYISLFKGHLQALGMRIKRIGYGGKNSTTENYRELVKCIKDHEQLLDFFNYMKVVISQTLFLQFIVTGFALCTTAVYFVKYSSGVLEIFVAVSYSMVLVCEALPCCYLMSGLMQKSDEFVTNIYSCNWIDQDKRFRITILMFMQKCQKQLNIVAGGLFPITLETYIQISKFSFSMFTILKNMK